MTSEPGGPSGSGTAGVSIASNTFRDQAAVQGSGVQHNTWITRSSDPRLIAIVLGVAAAVFGYLATSTVWSTAGAAAVAAPGGLVVGALTWLSISQMLERRRLAERRAARDQLLDSLAAPPEPGVEELAARRAAARADPLGTLLAPQRALLGLQTRREPLHQLQVWCTDLGGAPVRILAGPSGVGKTRLAVELARTLPDGWVAGRCRTGRAGEVWPPVAACADRTLIVVDDADTEPGIPELIRAAVPQPTGQRRIKVLLLVRDHPTYTRWLRHQPDAPDADIPATVLAPIGQDGDRRRWFARTIHAAAAALGTPPPAVSPTDTRRVGADGDPMILTVARGVLAAHIADPARVTALRTAGVDELAHTVLEVEQRRWTRTAMARQRQGLLPAGLRDEAFVEAMLALILTGPTTTADATTTLRRLPPLREEPQKLLDNLAAWARDLHGATVSPTPDFLHGALLAELARPDRRELLTHLDPDLDPDTTQDPRGERAAAVLARLVRAFALFPSINSLIQRQLAATHPHGLVRLLEVLILAGPDAQILQPLLIIEIRTHHLSPDDAARLLDLIGDQGWPRLHVALQEVLVQRARQRASDESTDGARAALADALYVLGFWLHTVGEHRSFLAAADEAVTLYRGLAATAPDRHTRDLAGSLMNLGAALTNLGEYHRALAAAQEVVTLYRDLASAEPDRYITDLAGALNNLSNALAEVGEHRRALETIEEAVALRRAPTAMDPDVPGLARCLTNLGNRLDAVGEHRRAVTATEEAVALYRNLAAAQPATHTADLAECVHNLGHRYAAVEEDRRALAASEEALTLYQNLAATDPDRHTPQVGHTLNCLAIRLTKLGEHRRALAAIEESVSLYGALVATEPIVHTPDLGVALLNLGNVLAASRSDDRGRALAATAEAVDLYRALAATEPAAHTPDLAGALNNLCVRLTDEEQHPRALAVIEEAVALNRALSAIEPATHIPHLTGSLTNLAICLERDGQWKDALRVRAEAVAWLGRLTALCPDDDTVHTTYQRARDGLARWVTKRGLDIGTAYTAEATASRGLPTTPRLPESTK